jgi:hypothetical protein
MNTRGDILVSSESIIVDENKNKHLKREQPAGSQSKAARAAMDTISAITKEAMT